VKWLVELSPQTMNLNSSERNKVKNLNLGNIFNWSENLILQRIEKKKESKEKRQNFYQKVNDQQWIFNDTFKVNFKNQLMISAQTVNLWKFLEQELSQAVPLLTKINDFLHLSQVNMNDSLEEFQ